MLSVDCLTLAIIGAGSGNRNRKNVCAHCKKLYFIVPNCTRNYPKVPYVRHTLGTQTSIMPSQCSFYHPMHVPQGFDCLARSCAFVIGRPMRLNALGGPVVKAMGWGIHHR